nr:DUF1330 domain-containing protein [Kribbella amoyensis]
MHGLPQQSIEGEWDGHLVVIEFPSAEHAHSWYDSPAYQEILPLRTDNSDSVTMLVEGVDRDHVATDVLKTTT